MKSISYYITIFSSLFILLTGFFIFFTANWHSSSVARIYFSVILMIYFFWMAVKKYKERNLPVTYNYKRLFASLGLMFLIAGILIFAASALQHKHLSKTQKETLILK